MSGSVKGKNHMPRNQYGVGLICERSEPTIQIPALSERRHSLFRNNSFQSFPIRL